ncbi:phosphoserine phosphatase SerB [Aliiglaciecola sp. LCG003]|uniref:phosphoserine phosphatase SerB n=1 Tax=Aliiglaciecola sp. LCG003 TaxID=3053655 RepID=UPI002573EDBF|nr:phosphoserine phosphatase SerB [Aliiglaciecola sp. LCG003]WJG10499.1 phosphoserine phosphatase SerB [Aliiglaciecola sp. LCG003]
MPTTDLTISEYCSAGYLTNLCRRDVCFALPQGYQLELVESAIDFDAHLIIFGEGLNVETLGQVQRHLAAHIEIISYSRGNEISTGFAIEAKIKILSPQQLASQIEFTAIATHAEIALLTKRPTLAKPGLLVMDMDSTVIGIECIDEIAKLAGVGEQVSEVTELAMQGKLDFAQSLISRVKCLTGADEAILQTVRDGLPINPGISPLLHRLKQANWKLAIASGGFTFFADYLKDRLGLDFCISNQLEIKQQRLTGRVLGDIVNAQTKADTLLQLATQYEIDIAQTIALGDGANDLVMMGQAGLGVAYHAKPIVRQQADAAVRFSSADTLLAYLSTDS